jgi:hypothetical protein
LLLGISGQGPLKHLDLNDSPQPRSLLDERANLAGVSSLLLLVCVSRDFSDEDSNLAFFEGRGEAPITVTIVVVAREKYDAYEEDHKNPAVPEQIEVAMTFVPPITQEPISREKKKRGWPPHRAEFLDQSYPGFRVSQGVSCRSFLSEESFAKYISSCSPVQ